MKQLFTLALLLCLGVAYAQPQTYTANNYESIENIAKTYRFSPADILKLNPGLKDGVQKGMTINIPISKVKHYNTQRPVGFTTHLVKGGETFFGLSQKYNITIDDLKRYNLDLYIRELQEGERITIPLFSKTAEMVQKSVQGQKRYVVKPQETLWRIAKNHNVSVEELEKLNKNEKGFNPNSIREGQEIWVPASSTDSTEPEPPARPNTKKEVVLYLVERGEGFYSLERKFGLSEAELVKLNPSLKDGLKSDAQIWIPKENYEQYKSASLNNTANYNFQNSNNTLRSASSPANVKEISYILPFKLSDVSTGQIAIIKSRLTENKLTPVATDFYSGALIALDSLQKMGYKFKVNVYDSEGDLKKIAFNASVQNSQVVIGPFTTKSFNTLASLVTSNNTILLAPLSNKNITLNPNVYQTLPNDEVLQTQMIDYLNKNYSDENMIILADSKNTSLREKLERSFPNAKVVTEMSANGFVNALNYNKENVVLLQSNDIGYVSMAVRLLHNALKSKRNNTFPKIMLATVDRGSVYDSNNLSNNQLSDLRFTYPTVNKYSNGTDSFSARYLKTYGILPNKYAIRGFDLTMDAVLRLGVSGNLTSANTRIGETSYLENKFAYLKNFYKGGGYENQGVYIVQYDNMEVKELK